MAQVAQAQNSWINGMKRDHPRDEMPLHSAWNMVDVVLNYGAPVRQRGGWANWSQDIASITAATATYILAGAYATFATSAGGTNTKNIAIDEDGSIFDVTTTNTATLIAAQSVIMRQNPVFHGGTAVSAATAVYTGLFIMPHKSGGVVPYKYDGASVTNLGGSPPKARYAGVYKDYTCLGNGKVGTTEYPSRVWFSPEGDPDVAVSGAVTAWDTTDSWIDFSQPVKGFGATKNALLVFGDSQVSRIRGSTPPPDEDMVVDDPLFGVGLVDAFSIVEYKDSVFWCAPEGVFRSDGVVLDDLTKKGGMLRHWLDLVAGTRVLGAGAGYTFAAGIIRDQLVISVMDGTTFKDCFIIDLQSYVWTRHSNIDAISFWSGQRNQADELFWGRRGAARVCALDSIFEKVGDTAYKADGDGDAVLPVLETAFYEFGKPGLKRIKSCYTGYELTDYATDNPTATLAYILTPEETSYTSLSAGLDEQTTYRRDRFTIGRQAPGIALKLTRVAAGDFLLYDLGFDTHALEPSRLAQ